MSRDEEITQIVQRSHVLADDYTQHLDEMVNRMMPTTLSNEEYAARCGGLMIALSREIGRCSATFGETHQIEPEVMVAMVGKMFGSHYKRCLDAIRGDGQTIQ